MAEPLEIPATFGDVVRKRREALRITQGELARRLGIAQSRVSGLEQAARPPMRGDLLARLAAVLEVSEDYLTLDWVFVPRSRVTDDAAYRLPVSEIPFLQEFVRQIRLFPPDQHVQAWRFANAVLPLYREDKLATPQVLGRVAGDKTEYGAG